MSLTPLNRVPTVLFLILFPLLAGADTPDSITARINSAIQFLDEGKPDVALLLSKTIDPVTLSVPRRQHASRLSLAGLKAQPGNHGWLDWTAKFPAEVWTAEERLWIAGEAMNAGSPRAAGGLLEHFSAPEASTPLREEWEILEARWEASRGNWKGVEARLSAWKNNSERRGGSGEILFWQGWAALQQYHRGVADSLFLLSSAYVDEDVSQRALEYRYALLLDTSEALYAYVRGLPESPLPDSARRGWLESVPTSSPLYPGSLWEKAMISSRAGNKAGEISALQELAKDLSHLPGRRAAAELAWRRFEPSQPDSAMAAYEQLLLQYQQGVPSEFARSRVQALRSNSAPAPAQKSPE